jgi:hypothetical protein
VPFVVLIGLDLGVILGWTVGLAVCLLVVYFAKAFFGLAGGLLGKLPVVGGWIDSGLTSIEHKIVSVMSGAAASCDARMGAAFHEMARLVDWLGEEISRIANDVWTLAAHVVAHVTPAELTALSRNFYARLFTIEGNAERALRRIDTAEKRLARGIGADVLPRVKSLEGEFAHTIEHDIASLRARERALEDGAINTWRWIRTHPLSLASTAFAGAVAIALQRIGASWIRCNNWNRIGKSVCGVPASEIESLLGLLVGAAALANFRELVKLAQTVERGVASGLQDVAKL